MANEAAPASTSPASFWSQKLQEDNSALKGVSPHGTSAKVMNGTGTVTNSKTTQKAPSLHKTTAATLAHLKVTSPSAAQFPQNNMVFKRKQLAKVFADSDGEEATRSSSDAKDLLIQQLEVELAAKDERIKSLEGQVNAKDAFIQDLKAEAQIFHMNVKEIVAVADEGERHTTTLEPEVGQKSETKDMTLRIETEADRSTCHHTSKEPSAGHSRATRDSEDRIRVWLVYSVNTNPGQEPTPETSPQVSAQDQASTIQTANNDVTNGRTQCQKLDSILSSSRVTTTAIPCTPSAIFTRAPAPRDDEEPLFSTLETVKVVPPVPKAPLIVFPQRNLQKASATATQATTSAPMTTPKSTKETRKDPGEATSHRPDVRALSPDQRKDLGSGPRVTISVGGVTTPTVPKKMIMQVSEVANDFFTKNPEAGVIPFPHGAMTGGAVCVFVKWMNEICTAPKEFSVKLRFPNVTKDADTQNLASMQAARVLGMSTYVRHFTRRYCDEIRTAMLPLDTIARIEKYTTIDDPVYECLLNNVAHHRSKKNIPDQGQFERFLVAHPGLAADLEKVNRKIQGKRAATRNRGDGRTSSR